MANCAVFKVRRGRLEEIPESVSQNSTACGPPANAGERPGPVDLLGAPNGHKAAGRLLDRSSLERR